MHSASSPVDHDNPDVTVGRVEYGQYQRMMSKTSSNRLESVFKSDIPSNTMAAEEQLERFNLTAGYLLAIMRLIDEYTIIKVNGIGMTGKYNPDYYYQQWEILDMLLNIIACKIKPEIYDGVRGRLDEMLDKFDSMFIQTDADVFLDKTEGMKIKRDLGKLFEDILIILDRKGMLTFKADDPTKAMGKYND